MEKRYLEYFENGISFKGYAAIGPGNQKRPVVLVCHTWHGQGDFSRQKAEALAEMGYIGFAVDMYGKGKHVNTDEEARGLMEPLLNERLLIRKRLIAALAAARKIPEAHPKLAGVIGFCFGGACALELARSGTDIDCTVSFHGLLKRDKKLNVEKIPGSVLVLHGYHDPLVSKEDIGDFQKEMNDAKADWQMIVYGNAAHAFTNPAAHSPETGMQYNKTASDRAWEAMGDFFKEIFV